MPLQLSRDDTRQRIVFKVSGTLTVDEWANGIAQLLEDGLWQYGLLYDATASDAVLHDMREMAHNFGVLAELVDQMGPRGPIVFATPDREMYRRARLYVDSMAPLLRSPAAVFSTLPEASAWLDGAQQGRQARER